MRIPLLSLLIIFCSGTWSIAQNSDFYINEFLADNTKNLRGEHHDYPDWIELLNNGVSSINLEGYTLTDNPTNTSKWTFPDTSLAPGQYLLIFASGRGNENSTNFYIHTNFKLSSKGEFLGLFDPSGNLLDSLTYKAQKANISYGRSSETPSAWGYFMAPTPRKLNGEFSFDSLQEPRFSLPGGYYSGAIQVELSVEGAGIPIYITLDGTRPNENSTVYSSPITLGATTAIRASTLIHPNIPNDVVTQTYFIDEPVNLPFISIVTDPDNLFSDRRGIYVTGTNGTSGWCSETKRNVNQDWERPVNLEYYNTSGKNILNQLAGIKIYGACSRTRFPQKSFALFARNIYGKGSFEGQLFPDKEIYEFESFILRSSADDQNKTMLKDAFAQYVQIEYMDIDYQAYQPTVVFINGVYWGIHNMREKINEHYLVGNFNAELDEINLLQRNGKVIFGKPWDYHKLIDLVSSNNLNDKEIYKQVQQRMDVNQYIDYQIGNIYISEEDWPVNNIKFWNTTSQEHRKWRWITYDRDHTFEINRIGTNTLALASATNGPGWPNPPWSTLLFRRMLTHDGFKNKFIQIYAYHMNMTFNPNRILKFIDSFEARIEDEIPRHIKKWGGQIDPDMNESWTPAPTFNSLGEWKHNIDEMRFFTTQRPEYAIQHVNDQFGLSGLVTLNIDMNNREAGSLKIFHKKIPITGYTGNHFRDVPITIKAVSNRGYQFSHWTIKTTAGEEIKDKVILEITLTDPTSLTAHFEERIKSESPVVLINEINYNSPDNFNSGDWVELYNNSDEIIELENWQLKDEDDQHVFTFRTGMELNPRGYIVVCESVDDFDLHFSETDWRIGDMGFKLNNGGEVIRLFDELGNLVDSVRYKDTYPWPELADGSGPTLELIHPDLENDLAASWVANEHTGSPGHRNHTITSLPSLGDERKAHIELFNNYPNPARASTSISYSIKKPGNVYLKLINIMGTEIKAIVNSYQKAGIYYLRFNTSRLPNGVYLYLLKVDNDFTETKRMIVDH